VARLRRRASCSSGSGEARGGEDQCVAMGATLQSREEVGSLGRRRERAEEGARLRRRQWRRRTAGSRAKEREAAFYSQARVDGVA
jgi:hypothetical protein